MPTYQIRDKELGVTLKVRGDSPPTEQEAEALIQQEAGRRGMLGVEGLPQTNDAPPRDPLGREIPARQAMPEQDFLDRAGTSAKLAIQQMSTMDPERFINLYEEEFPGSTFERTEDGKIIADFTALGGGRGVIDNVSPEGIAGAAVQFGPAGQWAQKGKLLWQMVKGAVGAGGTEAARDITSQGFGGTDEVELSNINESGNVTGATIGGGAAPAVMQVASRVLGRLVPGLRGKPVLNEDGTITDDAIQQLEQAGRRPKAVNARVVKALQDEDVLTPEQARRFNLFKRQGVEPTRANLTQSADDFQFQQEQFKTSGPLRTAVDAQDEALTGRTAQLAERTGGRTAGQRDTGQQIFNATTRKAEDLDAEIGRLYGVARETAGTEKVVRPEKMIQTLRQNLGRNEVSGGVVRAVRSELRQRGLLGEGFKPQGRINVNQAEELRQTLNSLYDGANAQGRRVLNQLKSSLDDDVLRVAGDDVFQQARKARANFSREFQNATRSKFDKGTKTVLDDVLEGKIEPERLTEKLIINKSGSVRDLEAVKRYLQSGTDDQIAQGTEAWNSLRRDAIEYMLDQATNTAGKAEGGVSVFNGNRLRKAMERIGGDRLRVLFSRDELRELAQLRKVGELRIPVSGTQQGKGPTAQAVEDLVDGLPGISNIKRFFETRATQKAAEEAADPIRQTLRAFERAQQPNLSGPASTVGVIANQ